MDLDYFTNNIRPHHRLFATSWIRSIGMLLHDGRLNERIGLVTIALSPSTTGSWKLAEELLEMLCSDWPEEMHLRLPSRV